MCSFAAVIPGRCFGTVSLSNAHKHFTLCLEVQQLSSATTADTNSKDRTLNGNARFSPLRSSARTATAGTPVQNTAGCCSAKSIVTSGNNSTRQNDDGGRGDAHRDRA